MRMPGRQSRAKPRGFGPWVDPDLLPPLPRPKKNRKPKQKKRFHHAFRVLLALGLIPTKSRQCDPLGLRLNRMHVMEGDCEKSSGCLTAEGAPEIGKPLEETDAKTPPVETKLVNGDHIEDDISNVEQVVKRITDDVEKRIQEEVEEDEEEEEEMTCEKKKEEKNEDKDESDEVDTKEEDKEEEEEEEEETQTECPASLSKGEEQTSKPPSPEDKEEKVQNQLQTEEEEDKLTISSNHVSQSEERQKRSMERDGEGEMSSGSESETGRKKIKMEPEVENQSSEVSFRLQNFGSDERERMIQEYISDCTQNSEELDQAADKLQKEVEALTDMARVKEVEWNALLRLRKLKEEMLERVLRRKRINCLDEPQSHKLNNFEAPNMHKNLAATQGSQNELMMVPIVSSSPGLMHSRGPPTSRNTPMPPDYSRMQRPILPKPSPYASYDQPSREGRIGTFVDVKSIIADFRARHPEYVPRRGRRMRGDNTPRLMSPHPSSLISMANMALGSGSRVRTVPEAPYNLSQEIPHPSNTDVSRDSLDNYKDHFKLNNNNMTKGPPPYPEVTLHPVTRPSSPPSSSLLHGILTKSTPSPANRPASFSPTLARLLTAPERPTNPGPPPHFRPQQPSRVSIAEILKSSKQQKSRNEITITPVPGGPPVKPKDDVVLLAQDDDDAESGDRLVIDEGVENEDVPQCQGCKQKSSQFVCAGCGNQWYCSRECQVTAWEEHSEVCSG
ncbi:histone-lysine N-methyltransferase SETD1B-like isoform X2 [Cimex lectularius]|uniref:MYND-type domain-containing protein n=1 Tax=Cimex lectularius TaxID=79782 RepID=A0A8I6SNJ7_CIMLE|nr:histone-lysine N-methyltransferase SETD1B-like isoform X2 [Cimex lectularius]